MTADTGLTSIKVQLPTRNRLAELAADHGTSIGKYVAGVAERLKTTAELEAEAEQTRQALNALGANLEPGDRAKGEALWAELDRGNDLALVEAAEAEVRTA